MSKYTNKNDRAEGWGWIQGSAASLIAWAVIVAVTGHQPSVGIVFGSMGMGAWKVFRNGRW